MSLTDHYEAYSPTKLRLELTCYEVAYMLPQLERAVAELKKGSENCRDIYRPAYEEAIETWVALQAKFQAFNDAVKQKRLAGEPV